MIFSQGVIIKFRVQHDSAFAKNRLFFLKSAINLVRVFSAIISVWELHGCFHYFHPI